jgi:hypothetical protein
MPQMHSVVQVGYGVHVLAAGGRQQAPAGHPSTAFFVSMSFNIGERCIAKCATGHWLSGVPAGGLIRDGARKMPCS